MTTKIKCGLSVHVGSYFHGKCSVLTPMDIDSNIDTLPETDICVIATTISAGIGVNVIADGDRVDSKSY